MRICKYLIVAGAMLMVACGNKVAQEKEGSMLLLVGSYNTASETSIGVYDFNEETGEATLLQGIKGIDNPSFMCTNAAGDIVYAVSEFDAPEQTALHAFSLNRTTGEMVLLGSEMNNEGAPCNIMMSPKEDYVVCANYWGGSMTIFPVKEDGTLGKPECCKYHGMGPHANQTQPHVHAINFTPDGKFLLANDLGLDCIHVYPVKTTATEGNGVMPLIDIDGAYDVHVDEGAGPRHLCWSKDGRFAYVIAELSGQIFTIGYDGERMETLTSVLADTINGGGSADIHLTSDGEWLYASHRLKGDGISIYHVNKKDGSLQRVGYQHTGVHPRNFTITPNDKYMLVACRDTDEIQIFERDMKTGLLKYDGRKIAFKHPVFVKLLAKKETRNI